MTHVLSLGAINKQTGKYVPPKIANKKDEYVCPDCDKDLILCQGEIIQPYFRHKVDNINPCHHYSNPTETQIHKDAKMILKSSLEHKIPISFNRICCSCKKHEEFEIPEMTETSNIELEYRFTHNGTKIADVAYIDNEERFCIFEICNTHKTRSENRPEPWFEIDAETLIQMANDNSLTTLQIPCIRCEKCEECAEKETVMNAIKQERENYINAVKQYNKSTSHAFPHNYSKKYYPGHNYIGDPLEFCYNCDKFLNKFISNFENNIFIKCELDKSLFDECYYLKFHRQLLLIKTYGNNEIFGVSEWGGWGGGSKIVDGCHKPTMYKFIKYYNLINPMNIKKHLQQLFAQGQCILMTKFFGE